MFTPALLLNGDNDDDNKDNKDDHDNDNNSNKKTTLTTSITTATRVLPATTIMTAALTYKTTTAASITIV